MFLRGKEGILRSPYHKKKMTENESNEHYTGKANKVLRFLSSSGEKVEELKTIRKEYGAQSEEYKNAVTTLEK